MNKQETLVARIRYINDDVRLIITNRKKKFMEFVDFLGFSCKGNLRRNGEPLANVVTVEDYRKVVDDFIATHQDDKRCLKTRMQGKTLVVSGVAEASPGKIRELKAFQQGDGSHWGLSDWYQRGRYALKRAIASKSDWTTGWYGSKKEIASAKISRIGGVYHIETSVSDDFDTVGNGGGEFKPKSHTSEGILEEIAKHVDKFWNDAETDRKFNQDYEGFSILKGGRCIETYIRNASGVFDTPPGDNYHAWGFQGESRLPKDVKKALEEFAEGDNYDENEFTFKGYTIRRWKD
jgi:hypothetical protein